MAGLTIAAAVGVAVQVVPSLLLPIPFIASTAARRFGLSPVDATVDHEGLWLGDTLVAPRADILDVWADPDDTDRRVSVAVKPDELLVLHFVNAGQARRFADALRPSEETHVFAGIRPRFVDALFALRLFAVVASIIVNVGWKSPVAGVLLILFGVGAYGFFVAKQIEVGPTGLTLRSFIGAKTVEWKDVTDSMLDRIHARVVRGPLLTTSPWTKHAHARAIAAARRSTKQKRGD